MYTRFIKLGGIKMVEQVYEIYTGDEKKIERVIADENIHYNHMVLNKGERLPVHFSNSNVYMTIVRGILTIGLNEQPLNKYEKGSVLKIPKDIKMDVANTDENVLELIVVKAPAP